MRGSWESLRSSALLCKYLVSSPPLPYLLFLLFPSLLLPSLDPALFLPQPLKPLSSLSFTQPFKPLPTLSFPQPLKPLPYPTLPYPTLPYPIPPYPTLPFQTHRPYRPELPKPYPAYPTTEWPRPDLPPQMVWRGRLRVKFRFAWVPRT